MKPDSLMSLRPLQRTLHLENLRNSFFRMDCDAGVINSYQLLG